MKSPETFLKYVSKKIITFNINHESGQPRTEDVNQASSPWMNDSCFQPGVQAEVTDKRYYSAFLEMLKLKTARLRFLL